MIQKSGKFSCGVPPWGSCSAPGYACKDAGLEMFENISFTFGQNTFTLPPSAYTYDYGDETSPECDLLLNYDNYYDKIVFGEAMFYLYAVQFDFENYSVSLAPTLAGGAAGTMGHHALAAGAEVAIGLGVVLFVVLLWLIIKLIRRKPSGGDAAAEGDAKEPLQDKNVEEPKEANE